MFLKDLRRNQLVGFFSGSLSFALLRAGERYAGGLGSSFEKIVMGAKVGLLTASRFSSTPFASDGPLCGIGETPGPTVAARMGGKPRPTFSNWDGILRGDFPEGTGGSSTDIGEAGSGGRISRTSTGSVGSSSVSPGGTGGIASDVDAGESVGRC
jgi:hypothetical protein